MNNLTRTVCVFHVAYVDPNGETQRRSFETYDEQQCFVAACMSAGFPTYETDDLMMEWERVLMFDQGE